MFQPPWLKWLPGDWKRSTAPHLGSHTFRKIFVRSLADCREEGPETLVTTHKEYMLCKNSLEESQTDSSSQQQKLQQSLRSERVKFPDLPQCNAQNVQFSKNLTKHTEKQENTAHSQKKSLGQKLSLRKPRHWKYQSKMLSQLS